MSTYLYVLYTEVRRYACIQVTKLTPAKFIMLHTMHNGYYTGSTFFKFATLCRRFGPLHQFGTPEYPWKSPCMELGRVWIQLNGETLPKEPKVAQTVKQKMEV